MKRKIYNAICIIISILFLIVMAVLFVASAIAGIWFAFTTLTSGHGIIASIVSTFPYFLFCIVPGIFFYGCFTAFWSFLKTIRNR